MDVFDDLAAEHAQLEAMLHTLTAEQWLSPSAAPGWTIADVVLHLAQTEENSPLTATAADEPGWREGDDQIDDMIEEWVRSERDDPPVIFGRWQRAHRAAVATLRSADPERKLRWAAAPLKPATLATTRIAEHWAHAQDIAVPLGFDYPDTDRLRHIAWLGVSTLPYAFGLEGIDPQPVFVELTSPSGETWTFGDPEAPTHISGTASEFCRIGARRLAPEDCSVVATGPFATQALRLLRNYAR
ncbi:MAG: maleylpyruvate isomerase family mycothiol-dependent enzyme [Actinobacteria bacterium]|nr:maleylpyruvate isomerase family mycothiol-dependent enzyme [Actinomycetota bacterium]